MTDRVSCFTESDKVMKHMVQDDVEATELTSGNAKMH
jgi:hypothetical protein